MYRFKHIIGGLLSKLSALNVKFPCNSNSNKFASNKQNTTIICRSLKDASFFLQAAYSAGKLRYTVILASNNCIIK